LMKETSVASFKICSQCCWSMHQNFLSIILKKSTSHCQPFFYSKDDLKMQTKQFSTKLHDTLAYTDGQNKMIWFRPSVGETCPCTSVQHGTTETVSTYLNVFVFSADVGGVCQCKISAKYGCSVTVALDCSTFSTCNFAGQVVQTCKSKVTPLQARLWPSRGWCSSTLPRPRR